MTRILDLDGGLAPAALDSLGLDALERIIAAANRLRAHRGIDPEGRERFSTLVARRVAAGDMSAERGVELRALLDEHVPAVLLAEFWPEVLDPALLAAPALGAYRQNGSR